MKGEKGGGDCKGKETDPSLLRIIEKSGVVIDWWREKRRGRVLQKEERRKVPRETA